MVMAQSDVDYRQYCKNCYEFPIEILYIKRLHLDYFIYYEYANVSYYNHPNEPEMNS